MNWENGVQLSNFMWLSFVFPPDLVHFLWFIYYSVRLFWIWKKHFANYVTTEKKMLHWECCRINFHQWSNSIRKSNEFGDNVVDFRLTIQWTNCYHWIKSYLGPPLNEKEFNNNFAFVLLNVTTPQKFKFRFINIQINNSRLYLKRNELLKYNPTIRFNKRENG